MISLFAAGVAHADEPSAFLWSRSIQFEAGPGDELVSVPLDSDVYRVTQDDLADVRVLSSDQQFVPFLIRKQTVQRDRVERRRWKARDVDLKPLEEGALEIRVQLRKDDPQPEGLTLSTPLKNFEQRVQVFEGDETDPLVSDAIVYDYSQYMDVSRRDIRLPKNSARSFRIVIGALTADQETQLLELTRRLRGGEEEERHERTTIKRRPFRIDRIDFFAHSVHRMVPQEASVARPVVEMKSETDFEKQQTVIEIRTNREPLTKLHLETTERNFSRRVRVLVPETQGVRTVWREIGQATVFRFRFRDVDEESLVVSFPEQRHETYRIVVDDRDSPPVTFDAVSAEGPVHELVYLASAHAGMQLIYGSEVAETPSYDVAAIRAVLKSGEETSAATLGDPVPNGSAGGGIPLRFKDVVGNPIVIGCVVCVLVALLAVALVRAGRRIDALTPDGEGGD
jgi:hypothetical protein